MGEISFARMGGGLKIKSGTIAANGTTAVNCDLGFFAKVLFIGYKPFLVNDSRNSNDRAATSFSDIPGEVGKLYRDNGIYCTIVKTETGISAVMSTAGSETLYYLAIG